MLVEPWAMLETVAAEGLDGGKTEGSKGARGGERGTEEDEP